MYSVKKQESKRLSITGKDRGTITKFVVDGPDGSYSFHDSENDAEIVAYGLNYGFTPSILGGFADSVVEEIKAAMAASKVREWKGSADGRFAEENQKAAETYLAENHLPDPWENSNDLWDLETPQSKIKLQADNINGVYKVEDFEGDVLSQEDFYASLRDNLGYSIICAEVDAAMAEKIEAEYGIH